MKSALLATLPIETHAGTFVAHYSERGLAELDFPSGKSGKPVGSPGTELEFAL